MTACSGISSESAEMQKTIAPVWETTVDIKEEREVGLRLGIRAKVGCELIRLGDPA
jgi:hypothetical protein